MSKMPHLFFFQMLNIGIVHVPQKSLFGPVFGGSIHQ